MRQRLAGMSPHSGVKRGPRAMPVGLHKMTGFILRRILIVIPTLLGVTLIIFSMLAITPGDPAELLLGERATKDSLEAMREYLGLKKPLYVQYGMFLKRVIKLDLGETIWTRERVSAEIMQRFPATIELA